MGKVVRVWRRGLSLVELLVVLAVVAVLAAIVWVASSGLTSRADEQAALETANSVERELHALAQSTQQPQSAVVGDLDLPPGVSVEDGTVTARSGSGDSEAYVLPGEEAGERGDVVSVIPGYDFSREQVLPANNHDRYHREAAVKLDDGRVLYAWGEADPHELSMSYVDSVDTFVTEDGSALNATRRDLVDELDELDDVWYPTVGLFELNDRLELWVGTMDDGDDAARLDRWYSPDGAGDEWDHLETLRYVQPEDTDNSYGPSRGRSIGVPFEYADGSYALIAPHYEESFDRRSAGQHALYVSGDGESWDVQTTFGVGIIGYNQHGASRNLALYDGLLWVHITRDSSSPSGSLYGLDPDDDFHAVVDYAVPDDSSNDPAQTLGTLFTQDGQLGSVAQAWTWSTLRAHYSTSPEEDNAWTDGEPVWSTQLTAGSVSPLIADLGGREALLHQGRVTEITPQED